ncbi:MAG TPA: DUF4446 family protein [Candidatus Krumholzibacteriaceae bacterium]|nr:DUF4446 family protein [Candidatus Krumholzibacteriaceae bacterium]
MSGFISSNSSLLISISIIIGIAAFSLSIVLLINVRRMRKPFIAMAQLHEDNGTEEALIELMKGVGENRDYIREYADRQGEILERLDNCYSGMGIVRYNAFEDIGGNQSYSVCLLSPRKNGIILSNLVARDSTRGYSIEINNGNPSRELSNEETESFKNALGSIGF